MDNSPSLTAENGSQSKREARGDRKQEREHLVRISRRPAGGQIRDHEPEMISPKGSAEGTRSPEDGSEISRTDSLTESRRESPEIIPGHREKTVCLYCQIGIL